MDALLKKFAETFEGHIYRHRSSTKGDKIAEFLYEDLVELGRSPKLLRRVSAGDVVINTGNKVTGRVGRRGDGTFGERVPSVDPVVVSGYSVRRGLIAEAQITAEFKIVGTKQTAQIGRVLTALKDQADVFAKLNPLAIRVAFVGVNHADKYVGHEGDRQYVAKAPPSKTAADITQRLDEFIRPLYDELLILPYKATNEPPYPFTWVNESSSKAEYSSALVRISNQYEQRF